MDKNLKITVKENKNYQLAYPHLRQSIDYPELIMLFSTKTIGTVMSTGQNAELRLGIKYEGLKPEAFRVFRGIITLTQWV